MHFQFFSRLQDKINESITTIESLERDNSRMKQEKMELFADLEAIKLEKKRLQTILEQEKDDKKRLTDRINTFSVIGMLVMFNNQVKLNPCFYFV